MEAEHCAICNRLIEGERPVIYDGDECHLQCALNDMDSCGMDAEFGDN
jgi:hypothetical protein